MDLSVVIAETILEYDHGKGALNGNHCSSNKSRASLAAWLRGQEYKLWRKTIGWAGRLVDKALEDGRLRLRPGGLVVPTGVL